MPSGAIMQLTSYGSENLYLVGNPQITFFRTSYQRHTNFAYEWVEESINIGKGLKAQSPVKMTIPIKRHGDLLRDIALVVDLPDIYSDDKDCFKWIRNIGHLMIDYVEFFIGGQLISKLYGQWICIWYELTSSVSKKKYIDELIGNVPELYDPVYYYGDASTSRFPSIKKRRLRIPIPFWFTTHPGLSVPLIALQYTEVSIQINFKKINDLFTIGQKSKQSPDHFFNNLHPDNINITTHNVNDIFTKYSNNSWKQNMFLDVKYIYLDDPERRIFSSAVSEYLITTTQKKEKTGLTGNGPESIDINCFHPVKEMIWTFQRDDVRDTNQWDNYTTFQNYEDYPIYKKLSNLYKDVKKLGTTLDLANAHLSSGTKVDDFRDKIINQTDSNDSYTKTEFFDNYLNIMYYSKFIFNNHDRQSQHSDIYYSSQEPYNSHTGIVSHNNQVYTMTFSEDPELIQPSGSINFSTLTTAVMLFRLKKIPVDATYRYNLNFYIRSMNVLRIMNGIGGLVFAN
tara:strand:+ start:50 stop:1582 length:1533 start_codon:yes stop_codon:yes gene_type:complete